MTSIPEGLDIGRMIMLVVPLILLHWTLVVIALVNLIKRKKVRFNNKILWGVIIVFIQVFGPVVYFLARGDEE